MTASARVFAAMWGVATVAHLAGNWRYEDILPEPSLIGVLLTVAGLLGTAVIVKPHEWTIIALSATILVVAILEAPLLGNHWLLAGFVSLAYLVSRARWGPFERAARWIVVLFYGWAAFSKLNSGFFDPATSCSLFYANQSLGEIGLGPIGASSPLGWTMLFGCAVVELSVVPLLLVRQTRPYGVLLAVAFHGIVSLDLAQHFYDFTAVLLPLFVLYLPTEFADRLELPFRSMKPSVRRLLVVVVATVGLGVTLASVTPLTDFTAGFLQKGSFLWWVPYLALVVWSAAGAAKPVSLSWRIGPAATVVAGLVFLNGLTPYLELKTNYSWNMYSNLVTLNGKSNHLLIRRTLPLRSGHEDLVEVIVSGDTELQRYAEEGYLLPWPSFLYYLMKHPEVAVVYKRGGVTRGVARAGDMPELTQPVPWWWRWMPLRSIKADCPDECQSTMMTAL
jgi:hypothetical protein